MAIADFPAAAPPAQHAAAAKKRNKRTRTGPYHLLIEALNINRLEI